MNDKLVSTRKSLSAKFIAQISAENMEAFFGKCFFQGFLVQNHSTCGAIVAFGAIRENM